MLNVIVVPVDLELVNDLSIDTLLKHEYFSRDIDMTSSRLYTLFFDAFNQEMLSVEEGGVSLNPSFSKRTRLKEVDIYCNIDYHETDESLYVMVVDGKCDLLLVLKDNITNGKKRLLSYILKQKEGFTIRVLGDLTKNKVDLNSIEKYIISLL